MSMSHLTIRKKQGECCCWSDVVSAEVNKSGALQRKGRGQLTTKATMTVQRSPHRSPKLDGSEGR